MARVLVLQTGMVGDVVMSVPALKTVRNRFPEAAITLVAGPWASAVLAGEHFVTDIVTLRPPWQGPRRLRHAVTFVAEALRLRRRRYDIGVDLRGDPRSLLFLYLTGAAQRVSYAWHGAPMGEYLLTQVVPGPAPDAHLVDRYLTVASALGGRAASRLPEIAIAPHERQAAATWREAALSRQGATQLVGIHPGAANALRLWKTERFAALIGQLMAMPGVGVAVFVGPSDALIAQELADRLGATVPLERLGLREFIVRASALDCFVGVDSAPGHIAAAQGVPVVSLFGPALPAFAGPIGRAVRVVEEGVFECRPCTQEKCVHPEASCMDAIGVEVVLAAVAETLGKGPAARGHRVERR